VAIKTIAISKINVFQSAHRKPEQAANMAKLMKKKRKKGTETAFKLPTIVPNNKCRLRLLKLERIKDYLLMEQEYIEN
jgi:hypothetical protein